jgi:uncharacterized membrane protein YbaN (DUF454 family)
MRRKLLRTLLIIAGTISVVLGIVGIFIPVLPTTPFLLLAAVCYLRSSDRFYRWLINNRLFGNYIKNYLEGRGMPLAVKIYTLVFLWLAISLSIFLVSESTVLDIILAFIAVGVTVHILLIKTIKQ